MEVGGRQEGWEGSGRRCILCYYFLMSGAIKVKLGKFPVYDFSNKIVIIKIISDNDTKELNFIHHDYALSFNIHPVN